MRTTTAPVSPRPSTVPSPSHCIGPQPSCCAVSSMKRRTSTCGDDEILWLILLQHQPLHPAIGMPQSRSESRLPIKRQSSSSASTRARPCDLARRVSPSAGSIKEHPIACIHHALAVVHCDPVGIELRYPVGAAGIEGRTLLLQNLTPIVELTGARLIDPRFVCKPQDPRLQDPPCQRITVGSVFRALKAHCCGLGTGLYISPGCCWMIRIRLLSVRSP